MLNNRDQTLCRKRPTVAAPRALRGGVPSFTEATSSSLSSPDQKASSLTSCPRPRAHTEPRLPGLAWNVAALRAPGTATPQSDWTPGTEQGTRPGEAGALGLEPAALPRTWPFLALSGLCTLVPPHPFLCD